MKFSEIPYQRPDIEAAKTELTELTGRMERAASFDEAEQAFLAVEALNSRLDTMASVANIRHDIDTRDEFYDKEVEFYDEKGPELQAYSQKWTLALLKSPFRAEFEQKYNKLMFLNAELELKSFSPEIIPELQRENALTMEYSKLLASAQIPFEGEKRTLSQMSPF